MIALLLLVGGAAALPQLGYYSQPQQPRFFLGNIPVFGGQTLATDFRTDHTKSPPWTVSGKITFRQNILTGDDASFSAFINGPNLAGRVFTMGLADDCIGTNYQEIHSGFMAPFIMPTGFYAKGSATGYNIDGAGGNTAVGNSYVLVRDRDWSAYVGCTASPLSGPLTQAALTAQVTALVTAIATATTTVAAATAVTSFLTTFFAALSLGRRKKRAAPMDCAELETKWTEFLDLSAASAATAEGLATLDDLLMDFDGIVPLDLCSTTELDSIKSDTESKYTAAAANIQTVSSTLQTELDALEEKYADKIGELSSQFGAAAVAAATTTTTTTEATTTDSSTDTTTDSTTDTTTDSSTVTTTDSSTDTTTDSSTDTTTDSSTDTTTDSSTITTTDATTTDATTTDAATTMAG